MSNFKKVGRLLVRLLDGKWNKLFAFTRLLSQLITANGYHKIEMDSLKLFFIAVQFSFFSIPSIQFRFRVEHVSAKLSTLLIKAISIS